MELGEKDWVGRGIFWFLSTWPPTMLLSYPPPCVFLIPPLHLQLPDSDVSIYPCKTKFLFVVFKSTGAKGII